MRPERPSFAFSGEDAVERPVGIRGGSLQRRLRDHSEGVSLQAGQRNQARSAYRAQGADAADAGARCQSNSWRRL